MNTSKEISAFSLQSLRTAAVRR